MVLLAEPSAPRYPIQRVLRTRSAEIFDRHPFGVTSNRHAFVVCRHAQMTKCSWRKGYETSRSPAHGGPTSPPSLVVIFRSKMDTGAVSTLVRASEGVAS